MLSRLVEDAEVTARAVHWGNAGKIEDKVRRGRMARRSLMEPKQA
jgi:cyclohexadieny/prephenate dehydrogenase